MKTQTVYSHAACFGCGIAFQSGRRLQKYHSRSCRAIHRVYKITPASDRLAALVDRRGPDECWNFHGAKQHFGHGLITVWTGRRSGYTEKAHRLAWQVANGQIPDGLCVCHKCDNPACCNPAHLFLGTKADNAKDMYAKGRDSHPRGEQHPNAKIDDAMVREIRLRVANGESFASVGRKFGIDYSNVSLISKRRAWAHVD